MKNSGTKNVRKETGGLLDTLIRIPEITIVLFIVIVSVFIGIQSESFFTTDNFVNISKQIAVNGILSIGMMLVIIAKGVDLSIGSVLALLCAVTGTLVEQNAPIWVAFPAILALGAFFGLYIGRASCRERV